MGATATRIAFAAIVAYWAGAVCMALGNLSSTGAMVLHPLGVLLLTVAGFMITFAVVLLPVWLLY